MPWLFTGSLALLLAAAVLPVSRVSAAEPSAVIAASVAPVDASLLFAGLDGAFSFQQADPDEEAIQSELIGIIVDGEEFGTELVYKLGEAYYLPAAILARIGVHGAARNGRFYLATPGGEVETSPHFFRDIYGQMFFHAGMLDEVLQVRWEFATEKYAINMTLPWWQQGLAAETTFNGQDADVDFHPSKVGITQVRLDHTQLFSDDDSYGYSNLLMRGRLADGIWRGELVHQDNRDVRAENYYWMRDFEHVQALAGHQEVLINPLLPTVETTGAQALYSSNSIEFDPFQDQTRSQYVRSFGIPAKDIEGTAQPGAIAELRVNERPIARVRVNLDGTYRFDQVRNNALQFQTTRVHVLDQRSYVELEVQDFTRTPIDLLLEKGQVVGFAGAGVNGNPLDPIRQASGEAAFGLVRYGITESLTMEAGLQSADGRTHQVAGLSASFGRRWALTASAGHHEGAAGYNTDFYGRGERWILNLRSQRFAEGFRTEASPLSSFNELRYEYWLNTRLSLGLHGRSADGASRNEDYLLPGMTWRFNHRNTLRIWPDFDGEYRFDLRTHHRQRDWFEFVHDSTGTRAEYRYFKGPQFELFGRVVDYSEVSRTTAEIGTIWYPNAYDDRSKFAASALGGDGGMGYRLTWQTSVLPGLFSHLELRDEPVATEYADPGLQVRWTVSVDLAISGGRPVPARNDFIQSRAGSIGGRLLLGDGEDIRSEGIEQVAILVDGRPHTAVLRGKHFFVRNIPPGVYEVALGSDYLPMSISPEKLTYRVRVVPAATTTVDFMVNREYGLGGRVADDGGAGLANVQIQILDEAGGLVRSVQTDSYGYYQISGLRAGSYTVRVNGADGHTTELEIVISDDFVFDANLTLASAP
jgi:hypothetical protein